MNRSSIIALAVLGALLAYFLTFGADGTRKLQAGFYKVISPFLSSGSSIKKQLTSVSGGLQTLEELEKDNSSLKVENRSLKATNQALRDVEHEVNRLRRALVYRERALFKLVPAEVLTRDSSTWWRTITINRGKTDGVEPDQPVVTDEGVVGKTADRRRQHQVCVFAFGRELQGRLLGRGKSRAGDRLRRARDGLGHADAR